MEEGEELPRILSLIAEDAPAAVFRGASGIDQTLWTAQAHQFHVESSAAQMTSWPCETSAWMRARSCHAS